MVVTVLGLVLYYYKKQKYLLVGGQINDFRLWFLPLAGFSSIWVPLRELPLLTLSFMNTGYIYSMLGPITLVVYYLDIFRKRHFKTVNIAIIFILLIFVSFFSVLSVKRNIIWGNPIRFLKIF